MTGKDPLALYLLGRLQIMRGGVPVSGIESDRGRALLAYLVVEGDRAHRRDGLGALLWPDSDETRMRQNLRRALYNLRQTLDRPNEVTGNKLTDNEPLLLVTPQDVQLNPKSDHQLDVAQFRALLDQCQRHAHPTLESCAFCNQQLATAVALYRGDFLSGFSLSSSERFEEWRLFTQESLHVRMLDALTVLAATHSTRQEHIQAVGYLQRQIELEPWREESHRALMMLFAVRGERSAALAQYEQCERILADELAVPPSAETTQLYEQILRGEIAKSQDKRPDLAKQFVPAAFPVAAIPAPVTPFIGRKRELALIAQQLSDPTCRLLTLTGLGGVGKTQLALTAAHTFARRLTATETLASTANVQDGHLQQNYFEDGIFFVSLADLPVAPLTNQDAAHEESEDRIASAIAGVLGFDFQAEEPLLVQLCAFLHGKAVLLVLDNYEHLLVGADLVSQLLAAAPRLKVMVTSREPLRQPDEWLLPIEGLSIPSSGTEAGLEGYESVALFVQWARRKQPHFRLQEENQAAVVDICQLVEGLPLGIVLAAACYPELTCAEISEEIRRNIVILNAGAPDLSPRHRSIQAVFDASWQTLTPPEQRALGRAAVFQGGFTRQAGLQITGATLGELSGLVTRVLVRRTSAGRYMMHELLRQFATAKLRQSEEIQANAPQERHSRYYLDWAASKEHLFFSVELPQAVAALRGEIDNLRAAWHWAVGQQHELLVPSVDVLSEFFEMSGLLREAELLFGDALTAVQAQAATPEQIRLEIKLTVALNSVLVRQGKFGSVPKLAGRVDELVQTIADPTLELRCVRSQIFTLMAQGDYQQAEQAVERAIALAKQIGDERLLSQVLLDQGKLAMERHRYAEAHTAVEQALQAGGKRISPRMEVAIFTLLGVTSYYQGEMEKAKAYDEQGLQLARALGIRSNVGDFLLHLGSACDGTGDYGQAQGYYQEALAIYRDLGARHHEITVLGNLGISNDYLGEYEQAIAYTRQALALQQELGKVNQSAIAFTNLALFYHQQGDQATALDYAQQGVVAAQADGDRYIESFALTFLGHAHSAVGAFAEATIAYQQALACHAELGVDYLSPEPLAGLARLLLAQDQVAEARTVIEPILAMTRQRPLEGIEEPMRVYHTCYQVLSATKDPQAGELLEDAYQQLQARAARIQDAALRTSFLQKVAAHQAIVTASTALHVEPVRGGDSSR